MENVSFFGGNTAPCFVVCAYVGRLVIVEWQ